MKKITKLMKSNQGLWFLVGLNIGITFFFGTMFSLFIAMAILIMIFWKN